MTEHIAQTVYFAQPGPDNTARVLEIAKARAQALGIRSIVVATSRGETAIAAARSLASHHLVAVTHVTGFREADVQELTPAKQQRLKAAGVHVVTAGHALGGAGRAVRNKLGTYQADELIAHTLRLFGQGVKVAIEITLMATDAGLVRTDEEVIAIGGTGRGADTALVLRPANTHRLFDLRVLEILCMPRSPVPKR
jgi:hypothetical protein